MPVTIVFDTSAVLAYTKGSIPVGELLTVVTDDGDTALIPATCLAEAYRRADPSARELLGVLAAIPCVVIAPLMPDQAPLVGITPAVPNESGGGTGLDGPVVTAGPAESLGIDCGHAVIEALAQRAQLATCEPAAMARLLPYDWPILDI